MHVPRNEIIKSSVDRTRSERLTRQKQGQGEIEGAIQ